MEVTLAILGNHHDDLLTLLRRRGSGLGRATVDSIAKAIQERGDTAPGVPGLKVGLLGLVIRNVRHSPLDIPGKMAWVLGGIVGSHELKAARGESREDGQSLETHVDLTVLGAFRESVECSMGPNEQSISSDITSLGDFESRRQPDHKAESSGTQSQSTLEAHVDYRRGCRASRRQPTPSETK